MHSSPSVFGTVQTAVLVVASLLIIATIGYATQASLLIPPLVATVAYVFGAPGIPGTQPRSIIFGHLMAAVVALLLGMLIDNSLWTVAITAGVAMIVMNSLKLFHIPAVATSALVLLDSPERPLEFLLLLVLGNISIILIATLFSRFTKKFVYPLH